MGIYIMGILPKGFNDIYWFPLNDDIDINHGVIMGMGK